MEQVTAPQVFTSSCVKTTNQKKEKLFRKIDYRDNVFMSRPS